MGLGGLGSISSCQGVLCLQARISLSIQDARELVSIAFRAQRVWSCLKVLRTLIFCRAAGFGAFSVVSMLGVSRVEPLFGARGKNCFMQYKAVIV